MEHGLWLDLKCWGLCQAASERGTVLGLARTGLIFTGIQEGAQPGGGG